MVGQLPKENSCTEKKSATKKISRKKHTCIEQIEKSNAAQPDTGKKSCPHRYIKIISPSFIVGKTSQIACAHW